MHPIILHDLKNYTPSLISDYLSHYNTTAFNIIIPKYEVDLSPDNYSIFWNYYTAAYAGQLLHNISTSFSSYIPCPLKTHPFRFEIEVENIQPLADNLAFILDGLFKDDEAMLRFDRQAINYFSDAFAGKIDSDCWSLLTIAAEYFDKI